MTKNISVMNSKQAFYALNTDDTDEFLDIEKGFYRELWNMIPGNEFTDNPSRQNMKGNTKIGVDFTDQDGNICIGVGVDNGRNRLIFFIHKPSGTDAIYLWNSGDQNATKIFEWSGLNFSTDNTIEHAFIVGDLLYWVEKSNPQRCLNIERALAGDYINKEIEIDLFKKAPVIPPIAEKTTSNDGAIDANRIAFNNYQFSYRYKYKDGIYSTISPYSKMVTSDIRPLIDASRKSIDVLVTVPENIEDYVEEISFLVNVNKLGIWKEFDKAENIDTSSSQTITKNFDGQSVLRTLAEEEYEALFEPIPRRSSAQIFINNRSIINNYQNGYDDDGNYSIAVTSLINHVDDPVLWGTEFDDKDRNFSFKAGGGYSVALCFYDEFHRLTTIKKKAPVNVPFAVYEDTAISGNPWRTKQYLAELTLTGTPPSYAKYFGITLSSEFNNESYMQIPVTILFYVAEFNEGDTLPGTSFLYSNSVYLDEPPSNLSSSEASYLHLVMPLNIPFIPDNSYQVRFIDETGSLDSDVIEPILEIKDNKIVIGNFDINDWSFLTSNSKAQVMVEIFKPKESIPEEYYEIGEVYPIEDFAGSRYIEGDTNYVTISAIASFAVTYVFPNIQAESQGFPTNNYTGDFGLNHVIAVEAPSRTLSSSNIDTSVEAVVNSETEQQKDLRTKTLFGSALKGFTYLFKPPKYIFRSYRSLTKAPSKTIDYSKIANNYGRTIIILEDEKELSMPNTIMNSDVYVEDTKINGLHSFDADTSYVLPYDRGEIVKMVAAEDVIVIVHERSMTTIYPGEAYVRQGDEESLVLTDNFLSQDRSLSGSLGSQDPSSIVEYDGRVYGLDRQNAEPWRKSGNGVTPLASLYKTKKWFVEKCAHYIDEDVDIVGGYDPYLAAYFISFPEVGSSPAETIAFFEKYNLWVGNFNFVPERYGYVSDDFVSFKDGVPWLHNANSVRNSFYGTVYNSKIKVLVNNMYNKDKILKAISLETNSEWTVTEITTPAGQSSHIPISKFKKRGDHYVADALRDENTPSQLVPAGKPAILFGREISGPSFEITLENSSTNHVRLRYINTRQVEVSGNILV